jgi:hypothetical protein
MQLRAMQLRWVYFSCRVPVALLSVVIAFPSTLRFNLVVRKETTHA